MGWFKAEVNKEHIAKGKPGKYTCPLALAIQDLGLHRVGVDYIYASFYMRPEDKEPHLVCLSPQARMFAMKFDYNKPVEPFVFEFVIKPPRR